MRRRFNPTKETPAYQAAIDHKQASMDLILSEIPNTSTFTQLAELVGYSHEWVRSRLIFTPYGRRLFKIGRRYQVPKGVAVEFVRSIFA